MLTIEQLAVLLLIGHIGSVVFISMVIKRQIGLFKIPTQRKLSHFRKVLFGLSTVILLGNLVPIIIDLLTFFVPLGRPGHLRAVSIAYALSNALIALVSAYLIWRLYRLAADPSSVTVYSEEQ